MNPQIFRRFGIPLSLACWLLSGCGGHTSTSGPEDAGSDTTDVSADLSGDGAEPDAAPYVPAPTAPQAELEPFPIPDWLLSFATNSDPVMAAIDAGTFELPVAGTDASGVEWIPWTLDEAGTLRGASSGLIYAVAEFYTADPTRIVVRADTVISVLLNGARQPGDVYHTRKMRVPLLSQAGNNLIVVRASAGRNVPEVWFEATEDEVHFNLHDITRPDLITGSDAVQYVGVPVLNMTETAAPDTRALVVESDDFEETRLDYPALGPGAATQVAFELRPKSAWTEADVVVPITLRIESPSLDWSYEREIEISTVTSDGHYRQTFRSAVDNSAQYYGVSPPTEYDDERDYALVLSLHGAGVQAINQAGSYSRKDWTYVVAATNRRPFGFDWEAWGRLDGLEVLAHAKETFSIDPTQVYVTGHSMGGHGTWQFGVLFPGLFAVVGPSAGWSSFETYGGEPRSSGVFGRARASSYTNDYVGNLARRATYILHGGADDNVPVREGRDMFALVSQVTDDVSYHEEPDVGHWWNGDASPGVDCVDWPPLFELMQDRRLDPFELDFEFTSPSPWVSPRHSFVNIESATDANDDCVVESEHNDGTVAVTTRNVRSMTLDGAALSTKGVTQLVINGENIELTDGPIAYGPENGKRSDLNGPFNQVLERPFCLVYPSDGAAEYRHYAAYLLSNWAIIGNGHGCALSDADLTTDIAANFNLVHLGPPNADLAASIEVGIFAHKQSISVGSEEFSDAAVLYTFPENGHLSAVMSTTGGAEYLLFRLMPYSSRFVIPDYLVWNDRGGVTAGFFTPDWTL